MKKLLFIFILSTSIFANYIENAIVACQTLDDLKYVEPHINKNSNKFLIPKNCLILTKNADISIIKFVDDNYVQILITDLNIKLFTLKSSINRL